MEEPPVSERRSNHRRRVVWRYGAAYNILVLNLQRPKNAGKHTRHAIYATETTGLLLIAFLLLVLTLVRYWHATHWSAR